MGSFFDPALLNIEVARDSAVLQSTGGSMRPMNAFRFAAGLLAILMGGQIVCAADSPARGTPPVDRSASNDSPPPEQAGVGIAWRRAADGQFFVGRIFPDTPAARNGNLHKGDRLVAVGQGIQAPIEVKGMPMDKVVAMIRGTKGTAVMLTIVPAATSEAHSLVVPLVRGTIAVLNRFGDDQFIAVGTKAADFEAVSLQTGDKYQSQSARGKIVVLEFSCSGCAPCLKQIDELQKLRHENPAWKDRVNLVVVAVDDEKKDAAKWVRQSGQSWTEISPVWSGPTTLKTFHVAALPTVYVLDAAGRVVAAGHSVDIDGAIKKASSH
jgi:thiol-disulfide isomerase/thioredoxin